MEKITIQTKRVYIPAEKSDGFRILVDRIWPRGMTKERLQADLWLKDVAPSTSLRKWFDHDPVKWEPFKKLYFAELDVQPQVTKQVFDLAAKERVTLLFAARSEQCNHAVALKEYLVSKAKTIMIGQ